MASIDPTSDLVREFMIAAHGDLARVKEMLADQPDLLNVSYAWTPDDHESGIQAAAHMGDVPMAEFLLDKGAPLAICTAAMLGQIDTVKALISQNPNRVNERGAHQITLMAHAAISGNVSLLELIVGHGVKDGVSHALGEAVNHRRPDAVKWLLAKTSPDLSWTDFQGRTPLAIAEAKGFDDIAGLLKVHAG